MGSNDRTQVIMVRPDDPERVIMDAAIYKTETEWWANKEINRLNDIIKSQDRKLALGSHDQKECIEKAVARYRESNNSFVFVNDKLHKDLSVLSAERERENKLLSDMCRTLAANEKSIKLIKKRIKLLQSDNKKLKAANASLSRPQGISLDELMMELTDRDMKNLKKATECYS